MASMSGQLLVATPTLKDPNFDRTVVLLVAHEPGGALGVVLNRADLRRDGYYHYYRAYQRYYDADEDGSKR